MAHNVVLPQWGMEMSDGTVVKWLKKEGDSVVHGEPLAEIETSKINSELESPADGVIARVLVSEGTTVDVGTVLVVIAAPGETVDIPEAKTAVPSVLATTAPGTTKSAQTDEPSVQVEPAARRLAKDKGMELAKVRGTGPRGRITLVDVERSADATELAPAARTAPEGAVELTGVRRIIAERMLRSRQESAFLTLTKEADVTSMVEARRTLREKGVGPLAIIIKAVVESLKEHPVLNAHLWGFHTKRAAEINIGVAVDTQSGLVVPVIRRADSKSVEEIAKKIRDLSKNAREGNLTFEDVSGGTFTVSSLGTFDVDVFTPILNPPESAILGVGRISEKPAVYKGEIVKRSMMWLSLTFDHRICDGVPAAQLLGAISRRLENTAWLGEA